MLGFGTHEEFFVEEFNQFYWADKRLEKRAIKIAQRLLEFPGSCIQEVFQDKHEARAAYDFFNNVRIKWQNMLEGHRQKTLERISKIEEKYVLAIQDNTTHNYTSH